MVCCIGRLPTSFKDANSSFVSGTSRRKEDNKRRLIRAPLTPDLIAAARKEGKIAFYSALELNISEKLARTFEARYPGITARVERSGAERSFQRIGQEQDSRINAVDLVCSTDPAHFIFWKRKDWIAPYLAEEMAKNLPRDRINPDGTSATVCCWFSVIGYNTE